MRESYKVIVGGIKKSHRRDLKATGYYGDFIRDMARRDDSIWVPTPVIPELGCSGNIELAMLIDFQRRFRPDAERITEGWFRCSARELLDQYGPELASLEKQSRILNRLERLGYVKRMVKGSPPLRYVWIDYDKFIVDWGERIEELKQVPEEV